MSFICKRSFQTSARLCQRVFGWGRTEALPLNNCNVETLKKPVCLSERPDYALHKHDTVTHVATGWAYSLVCVNAKKIYGFGLIGDAKEPLFDAGSSRNFRIQLMACGREHSQFVVREDDGGKTHLYSLGNGMYGQLGNGKSKMTDPGTLVYAHEPTKIEGYQGNITHIASGLDHTVFATDAHQLYAMGWGADGQLGLGQGRTSDANVPALLPWTAPIKKLAGSTDFTLALTENGEMWTWGNSEYGQGMTGAKIDRILEPVRLDVNNVVDMAAGGPFSVVLTADGCVHTCGYGVLGLGADVLETLTLRKVPGLANVKRVFAATDYAAALTADGQVYVWGLNGTSGRLGLGHTDHAFTPSRLDIDCPIHSLALGTHHALAISK
ncbi:hypothetical protein VTP01DRAFT_8199 [Rhizomucor pusillus]|uniref:uncharacterized protein n=1 Tax=Rhizomucor pusillus TaxID=4840 RepID=UPI003742E7E4